MSNERTDEKTHRCPHCHGSIDARCPNHWPASAAPVATVLVGARAYCWDCAKPMLSFVARHPVVVEVAK
jgi:hypothetical protein